MFLRKGSKDLDGLGPPCTCSCPGREPGGVFYNIFMRKILFCIFLFAASFANAFELKTGDLVFQAGPGSDFERAISAATSGRKNVPFTHVGVAERGSDGVFVWEASPQGGVKRTPLGVFLAESAVWDGKPAVEVFRLKRRYCALIPAAMARIRALEGCPYDFLFLPDNEAYYCSELVQTAFLDGHGAFLFPSAPMSFADKETGRVSPLWVSYFSARGAAVPEGVPGSNPGDMSKSGVLKSVHRYF